MPVLTLNGIVLETPHGASPSVLMWRQLGGAGLQQEMRQVQLRLADDTHFGVDFPINSLQPVNIGTLLRSMHGAALGLSMRNGQDKIFGF